MNVVKVNLDELIEDNNNARIHSERNIEEIKKSLKKYKQYRPFVVQRSTNKIIVGNGMYRAMKLLGIKEGWVEYRDLSDKDATKLALTDNRTAELAEWDIEILEDIFNDLGDDKDVIGWNEEEINGIVGNTPIDEEQQEEARQSLKERFPFYPLSVLNARSALWQERKRQWLSLGIKSEISRENIKVSGSFAGSVPNYFYMKEAYEKKQGHAVTNKEFEEKWLKEYLRNKKSSIKNTESGGILSVFDPVLCELMYYWFSFEGAKVLDVFAGGSVRGIVAQMLNRDYTGIDLSKEQIEANIENGKEILGEKIPNWIAGNSMNVKSLAPGEYDFIFSCPPYFDLEIYSDSEEDLSNKNYDEFITMYRSIINDAVSMLKDNRFACFVVGDVRDKKTGMYRNFVSHTISAFEDAGMSLYNEIILVTSLGSLPLRLKRVFNSSRKVGKTHQNVLVFYKGDQKKIKEIYKDINVLEMEEEEETEPFDLSKE
jgi:DNA modification methylase